MRSFRVLCSKMRSKNLESPAETNGIKIFQSFFSNKCVTSY